MNVQASSIPKLKGNVLVVDDEPDGFDVIEGILFHEKYNLQYASSGFEALRRLENDDLPDIILLDVMMPGLDGLEVCRRIKANSSWQHIPIIMVTALQSKVMMARCLELGADDFVNKPLSSMELRARVRSLLRIKHQYDALQTSLQLRQDMSSMIVHDLRNPLTSILFGCEVLKRTSLDEKQQRKVSQIEIAGHQLQSLIDSLLMMAKLEEGKMVLDRETIHLTKLCGKVLKDFEPIAAQRQLALVDDFPSTDVTLNVDATLLRRVFDNLLSNAIKFSPNGGKITLTVSAACGDRIQICVADEGIGVKEEIRQLIFEKYEVGNVVSGVTQIGLGLAFCKMAIEAHCGTISVSDNIPKGAVFCVELPANTPLF